jgi:hypothetical protein
MKVTLVIVCLFVLLLGGRCGLLEDISTLRG